MATDFNPMAKSAGEWDRFPMSLADRFIAGLKVIVDGDKDLTPAGISSGAGLDNSTVRKWFEGKIRHPNHRTMLAVADHLGSTIEDICAGRRSLDPEAAREINEIYQIAQALRSSSRRDALLSVARDLAVADQQEISPGREGGGGDAP